MPTTPAQAVDAVRQYFQDLGADRQDFKDWASGSATGGPNSDGYYPLKNYTGQTLLLPCPDKIASLAIGNGTGLALFVNLNSVTPPAILNEITTTGYHSVGVGGARYRPSTGTVETAWRTRTADGRWWEIDEAVPYVEQFGVRGNDENITENSLYFQAALDWASLKLGGNLQARPGTEYFFLDTLSIDTPRVGFDGNGCWLNFRYKDFRDVALQPDITTNGGMTNVTPDANDARAYTGWLIGTAANITESFTAGAAAFANGKVGLNIGADGADYDAVANGSRYIEVGQKVTAPLHSRLRATVVVNYVNSVEITTAGGVTTQSSMLLSFGTSQTAGGVPVNLSGMGGISPNLAVRRSDFYDELGAFKGPQTFEVDVELISTQMVNPYFRIQSSTSFEVESVVIKVVPENHCLLFTAKTDTFGHNRYKWERFGVRGSSLAGMNELAIAMLFNADPPLSARAFLSNVQTEGANVHTAVQFWNGAYLCSFEDCLLLGRRKGIHTLPGALDAGENIIFRGGVIGSAFGTAIHNEGNMQLNFHSISSDFPKQWFKGSGQNRFVACHFEKTGQSGQEDLSLPAFELESGTLDMIGGRIQVNNDYFTTMPGFISVGESARATFHRVNMSNMYTTDDVFATGNGTVIVTESVGGSGIPTIVQRNPELSVVPDGAFAGASIGPDCWIDSKGTSGTARDQISRSRLDWGARPVAFNGTLAVGSNIITAQNVPPSTLVAGYLISGPGIPVSTAVEAWNSQPTPFNGLDALSMKITSNALKAGAQSLFYQNPAVTASSTMERDATVGRTTLGSVKITKGAGLGNANPIHWRLLVPISRFSKVGAEMFLKLQESPGAADGLSSYAYVRTFWVAVDRNDAQGVPVIGQEAYTGIEDAIEFDRKLALRRSRFTGDVTLGSDIITGLSSGTFSPFRRLKVGDSLVATGIPVGATVAEKINTRVGSAIVETIRMSAAATATTDNVAVVSLAADPWARTSFSAANQPTPMDVPVWATHMRMDLNMGALAGPISMWVDDIMATPW